VIWLEEHKIYTLNIAGNASSVIEEDITTILTPALRIWKERHETSRANVLRLKKR
jgi:hypothetical protein